MVAASAQNLCLDSLHQRASRRATNALWMTLYGAGASSVIWWEGQHGPVAAAVWVVVAFTLGLIGIVQVRRIHSLPDPMAQGRKFDGVLARKIGTVILTYTIAEAISAGALHALHQDGLIFPIAVAIAGAHFWVFARVLETWQYYVTGILDCLAVAITLLLASPDSKVGAMSSWIFYPLLGGGVALFITAGVMLCESAAIVRRLSHAPAEVAP